MSWYRTKKGLFEFHPDNAAIDPKALQLEPATVGADSPDILELGQFWKFNNKTYCFRPECRGCSWEPTCVRHEVVTTVGPGMNIRRAICARPGYRLAAIDYSGIELRLAAEFSGERTWMDAFIAGGDPHREMAKIMFHTENPTDNQRKMAKVGNFNLLYLGGPFTIRQKTHCSEEEAQQICEVWWANVTRYAQWTQEQWAYAKRHRGVHTAWGRFRNMEELLRKSERELASGLPGPKRHTVFARRTSINSVIQGSSADLMKMAMINVQKWIEMDGLEDEIHLLLTVHDELLVEIRDDIHFGPRAEKISQIMCPSGDDTGWRIPILTDIEVGPNWAENTKLKDWWPARLRELHGDGASLAASGPPAYLLVQCRWSLNDSRYYHLLSLLEEAILATQHPDHDDPPVPVRVQLRDEPHDTGVVAHLSESVLRRVMKPFPELEILRGTH